MGWEGDLEVRQHLLGERHERRMAQRRAHQMIEKHLLTQLLNLIDHALRRPMYDDAIQIVLDRIKTPATLVAP